MMLLRRNIRKFSPMLRRSHRSSWMISGWLESSELGPDSGGTACLTLGVPNDFVAARIGFANIKSEPWHIARVVACSSATFSDYVRPTGTVNWIPFTMAGGGEDRDVIVADTSAPTSVLVHPVSTSTPIGTARWTWTDWVPIKSQTTDPTTGMRVLMLRAFVPSNQTVTFANGQLKGFTGNRSLTRGHDIFMGGVKFNFDGTTDLSENEKRTTQLWKSNQLTNGCLFPVVQILMSRPGIVGLATGDSHFQGTSTVDQFCGFPYLATVNLNYDLKGEPPFSIVNCSVGGSTSEGFFNRFRSLEAAVKPSYAVLPGWTYNDRCGNVHANGDLVDIYFARLLSMIDKCHNDGILPIVMTPFPRDAKSMGSVQREAWNSIRNRLLALRLDGLTVVDASKLLGDFQGEFSNGTYKLPLTDDGMHPNHVAHEKLAELLTHTLKRFL